jgi:hypothetical protein
MPFKLISPFSETSGYARVPSLMLFMTKKASYIFLIDETPSRKFLLVLSIFSSDERKAADDCWSMAIEAKENLVGLASAEKAQNT